MVHRIRRKIKLISLKEVIYIHILYYYLILFLYAFSIFKLSKITSETSLIFRMYKACKCKHLNDGGGLKL